MQAKRYQELPAVIEAFRYDGDLMNSNGDYYIPDWVIAALSNQTLHFGQFEGNPGELFVFTPEYELHHVPVGDYIICDADGGLYPCKPDIFERKYKEIVE